MLIKILIQCEERLTDKVKITFTNSVVSLPQVNKHFDIQTWCPMMIKNRDQHQYKWYEYQHSDENAKRSNKNLASIYTALNTPTFRDSLKEAYLCQPMSEKRDIFVEEE